MSFVLRFRAGRYSAAIAALLYLICIVATPAALAMTNGQMATHCLSQDAEHFEHTVSHASNVKHVSAGDYVEGREFASTTVTRVTASLHSDNAEQDDAGICCGLFSVVAISQMSASPTLSRSFAVTKSGWVESSLEGRAIESPFEPPIVSLLV